MAESVVVLVVLSEAALKTFGKEKDMSVLDDVEGSGQKGDVGQSSRAAVKGKSVGKHSSQESYGTNDFIFPLIRHALKLHEACGVRILGLYLAEKNSESLSFVKFEGWRFTFNDTYNGEDRNECMNRLFAIQGINIDPDDWEFKVPALFASFYAAQDDLNANGWWSVSKIIPWKLLWGFIVSFSFCFFMPIVGFPIVVCYWQFSKGPQSNRQAHFSAGMFGMGLSLILITMLVLVIVVGTLMDSPLCSDSCAKMVHTGFKWTIWIGQRDLCSSTGACNATRTEIPSNNLSPACAECICKTFYDDRCNDKLFGIISFITCVVALWAAVFLCVAMKRLLNQSLTNKYTSELQAA